MIICVCKALSEDDLKAIWRGCNKTLAGLQIQCGAATDCGACLKKVEKLLEKSRDVGSPAPANRAEAS